MIYLYALLDSATPPPTEDLTGVTGIVEATRMGRGWLIHSPAEDDQILPKRRQLLAHARVQEALMPEGTVLPMRFGIFADDLPQITRLFDQRADEIAERFDALAGRAEVGLRIGFPRDAALAATLAADSRLRQDHNRLSGLSRPPHFEVAEFGRRLADSLDQRRGAAQKRLISALRGQWEDYVLKAPDSDVEVLSVECLVASDSIDAVARRAQDEAAALSDFAGGAEPMIQIVGPVPAFHFVELALNPREAVDA
jgi:hypothetical protein